MKWVHGPVSYESPDYDTLRTPPEAVVSIDEKGAAISLLNDDYWDLRRVWTARVNTGINFRNFLSDEISEGLAAVIKCEVKQAIYHLMFDSDGFPAFGTLLSRSGCLKWLGNLCGKEGLTLGEGLQNIDFLLKLCKLAPGRVYALTGTLGVLSAIGSSRCGFIFDHAKLLETLLPIGAAWREDVNQHAPIPSELYSRLISGLEGELRKFEALSKEFTVLLKQVLDNEKISNPSSEIQGLLKFYGAKNISRHSVGAVVTKLSMVFELLILLFSGMRHIEARMLPFDCLSMELVDGRWEYLIHGFSTKENGGLPSPDVWVTSSLGARAVRSAQAIYHVIHRAFQNQGHIKNRTRSIALFCALGIGFNRYRPSVTRPAHSLGSIAFRLNLVISENDVEELMLIDTSREWKSEPQFSVGTVWPLQRHQARRSLTLYAHASGIVSFPSLKRQLKQIIEAVTRYYGKGSHLAPDATRRGRAFRHVAAEWKDNQPLAVYYAYLKQVLFADEALAGGHGNWVGSAAAQGFIADFADKEITLDKIRKGEICYRETVLGGCTSTSRCERLPLELFPKECLEKNCRHLVVSPTKLNEVIDSQKLVVAKLRADYPGSVEDRLESDVLGVLEKFKMAI
ncbi:hypothetical protein [Pseudorhodoferax sp. Leaf265]|uniref:hypothetical protein n=1 Tax=Pseudorhodoferax sp. Leaf265 TaxID=1736315 RepID=UPI000A663096|nr:hypothetical protein [Pseudorhodoferax sp. Leaf265]